MSKLFAIVPLLTIAAMPLVAQAEEAAPAAEVSYVELSPAFVANFQASKIRYLKADVTLKIEDSATAEAVRRHQPYIRNNLVMLFSRQTEEGLQSPEGRQHLKEEALQEVLNALQAESEPTMVKEVLFTSFIVD
ncbi:MAG: flagellar basal body-associated FliL family protein [Gammaproteobacteria bacterium]